MEDIDSQLSDTNVAYTRMIYNSGTSLPFNTHGIYWNRTHCFPKSYGICGYGDVNCPGSSTTSQSATDYTDLHNLHPAQASVNSARGVKPYDECYATDSTCKQPAHELASSDTGTNKDESSLPRWMPPAAVRGDLARSNMYTALRYNGTSTEEYTEQLTLSSCACKSTFTQGNLTTLLKWFDDDPVDTTAVSYTRVAE